MSIDTKAEIPLGRMMENINDDLGCIVRLVEKPEACMSAPEVMGVIRLALQWVRARYESLNRDVLIRSGQLHAERDRCLNIVRHEAEGYIRDTIKGDMLKRIERKIEDGT
jgi:hypothetical protein